MKKFIKVLIINIIVIISLVEILGYFYMRNNHKNVFESQKKYISMRYAPVKLIKSEDSFLREIKKGNEKKGSILFFGCSFTYGVAVEENENLPYQFAELTDMTSVNKGFPGGSIVNSLNDLFSSNFYEYIKEIPKPVKYIVYMYIPDHLGRILMPYYGFLYDEGTGYYKVGNEYDCNDEKCIQKHTSVLKRLLYHLYITKAFYTYTSCKAQDDLSAEKVFVNMAKQAKKITDEKFPDSKFIMIMWKDGCETPPESQLREQLSANGFIVLEAEDLAGHELDSLEWKASDNMHPNKKAFYDVAVGLKKYLNE